MLLLQHCFVFVLYKMQASQAVRDLWAYRNVLILVLTPLIVIWLPICYPSQEAKCAYVVIIMAVYWMTEVVPLAVTAMMPIFCYPALGILSAKATAINYMKDTNFLFIGGLMMALAVEGSNLHKRIALAVLLLVGSSPRWLLLGFMLTTWFLSMWISNTATTAMMLPIVQAVLAQFIAHKKSQNEETAKMNPDEENSFKEEKHEAQKSTEEVLKPDNLSSDELKLVKCMLLSVAYAANIGGTGTLTGTPPNIVMTGLIEGQYGQAAGVSFAAWMAFSLPGAIINLVFAWLWLQLIFLGWRTVFCITNEKNDPKVKQIIRERFRQLGPFNWAERSVLILFILLVLLWLLRDPKFIPGWQAWFTPKYMTDGAAAIFVCFLLFCFPFERPNYLCLSGRDTTQQPKIRKPLLEWDVMQKRFPWGVVILLGGGFALGAGVKESGLSELIGNQLSALSSIGPVGVCAVAIILMTFVTEVTSNTATATIFIPILCSTAEALGVHPLYFVLAITVCASYAFMLPVATPPNAIVFGAGVLKVADMAMVGFVMNWLGILVMLLSINTWTYAMFNLGEYPDWAPRLDVMAANGSITNSIVENSTSMML